MKRLKRYLISALVLGLLSLLAYGVWYQTEIIVPERFIHGFAYRLLKDDSAEIPFDKTRKMCHKMLRYRRWDPNTALQLLVVVGNNESIPYLIRELKWVEADENGGFSFATMYCSWALEKTSGMNLGHRYEPWEKWWREEGSRLSSDEINTRASNHWERVLFEHQIKTQQKGTP